MATIIDLFELLLGIQILYSYYVFESAVCTVCFDDLLFDCGVLVLGLVDHEQWKSGNPVPFKREANRP